MIGAVGDALMQTLYHKQRVSAGRNDAETPTAILTSLEDGRQGERSKMYEVYPIVKTKKSDN